MIVLDTNLVFAVRCANCGRIKFHSISTFELLPDSRRDFCCECGKTELTASLTGHRTLTVQIPCIACDENHTYKYSINDILRKRISIICCSETGLELCFLGREKDVRETVIKYQEDLNMLLGELGLFQDAEDDVLKNIFKRTL